MQRKNWMASERAGDPNGFIQAIGDSPFFCTFYLRQKVELFLEMSNEDGGTVHFDATKLKDKGDAKNERDADNNEREDNGDDENNECDAEKNERKDNNCSATKP